MERLEEMLQGLSKQFADRSDTKKALKNLEHQIKNLYDLIMSKIGGASGVATEEDALLSKKHLCGISCASCEKDLVNIYGRKVDFVPWGRLPFRDPNERIARVGQGFSKMLSMVNPNTFATYELQQSGRPTTAKIRVAQTLHQYQGDEHPQMMHGSQSEARIPEMSPYKPAAQSAKRQRPTSANPGLAKKRKN